MDTGLVRRVECLFSSQLAPVPIGQQRHMCVNNLPRVAHGAEQPGVEPVTSRLQVRCLNHYATQITI